MYWKVILPAVFVFSFLCSGRAQNDNSTDYYDEDDTTEVKNITAPVTSSNASLWYSTTTTSTARIPITFTVRTTTPDPPEFHFTLRECVRTVAKIEFLEDFYDELDRNLGRLASNLAYLVYSPSGFSSCRWPVNYVECLADRIYQSGISYFLQRIWDVFYKTLTVLQTMFIGVVHCFYKNIY